MGQGSDRIADDDSTMVEDLLKFDNRLSALTGLKKGFAAHIDGIQGSEEFVRSAELIRSRNLQSIDGPAGIAPVESDARANHRQVAEAFTTVFSGKRFSRSLASALARESPTMANARAAPYSTSELLDSLTRHSRTL